MGIRSTATTSSLPKPVLDRIRRYAKEGWEPRSVFGHDGCRLLAVSAGENPIVVLRAASRDGFSELRSAAMVEWMRAAKARLPRHC